MSTHKDILVTQPSLPALDDFLPYLQEIWDSKWLTNMGRFHDELEEVLCQYLGVQYISLFTNGTLALITALQALRITGEVITTPFSFVATTPCPALELHQASFLRCEPCLWESLHELIS